MASQVTASPLFRAFDRSIVLCGICELAGRIGQVLNAGGKAYRYAPAGGEKGKRIIVEAEAKIVRRIFEE